MPEQRDIAAFSEFVAARSGPLFRTAYLVVGDYQLAQDLLQEALVKTLIAWPRLRDPEKIEAYVRRTVVTTAISWRRRLSFHERAADPLPDTPIQDRTEELVTHQVLLAQLGRLSPRQRAAIVLRYYEDLTEAQTAEVMGCSVGAVKSQVAVGLQRLRDLMGSDREILRSRRR
jgi:RNA polymerase sigma-70 factor (sigma-E family)